MFNVTSCQQVASSLIKSKAARCPFLNYLTSSGKPLSQALVKKRKERERERDYKKKK
jgi:hypothetical protein